MNTVEPTTLTATDIKTQASFIRRATIEISNTTPLPALIYGNEGIGQLIFFRGEPPTISYADRKGKYQSQPASIVMAKV